jgi:hypothetical protein
MKKLILYLFPLVVSCALCAQPANDDCSTAQSIGTLPTPANCPNGAGASLNIAGTLNGMYICPVVRELQHQWLQTSTMSGIPSLQVDTN